MQSDDFCDLFEERYLNWISFYTISWVQASLNILHSFISEDIWYKTPDNTNVAESCHANENQDAKKYGKINFITCQTQDQYGIRKTGKDLGVATREKQAIHRSIKRNCSNKKVTQTSTSSIVNDDLEKEKQMISLREKKFELEEKELKLEKERLEILKLKRELGVTDRQLELIYLPFTKGFDDCLAIDT
ncbi:hypothetical protein RhiirA1_472403 [Rhizophagus irregularis]|uniref:Uncharacterized protein n=1 Tax=Rhizophagus irregularis TaxID=588596 RepID=A0A2N0R2G2_9GLOM|nr:hypothetical protein RhiirA1_472403 [Rhizophagus irregularis]